GFVQHPKLATTSKSVAAFHQLRCLHGIQLIYHMHVNQLFTFHNPENYNAFLYRTADEHMQRAEHCFEYLRQAIMCAADSNLEDLDEEGDAKWGPGKRVCRNFEALKAWSEK
ncbi:hypothetical protein P280DRAFT_366544, partial [Massarina eburnea CBS 473.64]